MSRKLPVDAFAHYLALGTGRSYAAVAQHYGVTKRAVTKCAERERWPSKLQEAESRSRASAEKKAIESMEEMKHRHLQTMQLIQRKALETLRSASLESAMEAVRALALAVDRERLIRGEATERTAVSVEELVRREYEKVMVAEEDSTDEGAAEAGSEVAHGA